MMFPLDTPLIMLSLTREQMMNLTKAFTTLNAQQNYPKVVIYQDENGKMRLAVCDEDISEDTAVVL